MNTEELLVNLVDDVIAPAELKVSELRGHSRPP